MFTKKSTFIALSAIIIIPLLLLNIFNLYRNNSAVGANNSLNNYSKDSTNLVVWGSAKINQLNKYKESNNRTFSDLLKLPKQELNLENQKYSAGYKHFGRLDPNGTIQMQGDNRVGQVGDGTNFILQTNPQKLTLKDIMQLESNYNHSLSLDKNGEVYSWGLNLSGQIGNGNNENKNSPTKVNNLPKIKSVNAGYRTSFGISEQGIVYGWGGKCDSKGLATWKKLNAEISGNLNLAGGYYDRAGNTSDDPENYNDCNEISEVNMNINSNTPKIIEGLENIQSMSAGYGHFLALNQVGGVYSWGCNLYGQLGRNQNINDPTSQKPTLIEGLNNITQIEAGFRHSLALDKDGNVYSWGHNEYGELGNNSTKDLYIPTKINNLPKIKKIVASHDYSLAIDENNNLWLWGENLYQQIDSDISKKFISTPQKLETKSQFLDAESKGTFILAKIYTP